MRAAFSNYSPLAFGAQPIRFSSRNNQLPEDVNKALTAFEKALGNDGEGIIMHVNGFHGGMKLPINGESWEIQLYPGIRGYDPTVTVGHKKDFLIFNRHPVIKKAFNHEEYSEVASWFDTWRDKITEVGLKLFKQQHGRDHVTYPW